MRRYVNTIVAWQCLIYRALFPPPENHPSESLTIYLCQTTTTTTVASGGINRAEEGRWERERERQKSRPYDISKWCCGDFFEGDEIGNK